jgi:hypothetical protein
MNSNRLPLVGLVVMIIIAVFALVLQQQAVNDVRAQMTRAASADNDKGTAVAMAQAATGTLAQLESGQATALAAAQSANTAQATAQSAASTAAARLGDEGTRSAQFAATTTANAEAMQATVTMHANDVSTLQAESNAEVATLQGQLVGQATTQADLQGQLGTATAQVDLAEFARKAAEDDRTTALNQLWALGTRQADSSSQLATAQVILTGAPPSTAVPRPSATPQIDVTSVNSDATATSSGNGELSETFETSDKKVQLNYPAGWLAQETQNGSIILGSEEAVLTRTESVLTQGQVQVEILVGTYAQFNFKQGTAPTELLNGIVAAVKSNQAKFAAGNADAITLGDYKGAQALGSDGENDVTLVLVQLSDTTVGVAFASSASGEGANSLDTLKAIMGSISYTE